jgi:monofunctional biosynthetic peptidoglycan transglycosylase
MMADKPITGFGWARPETSYDAFYLADRMLSGAAMRTNDYLVIGVALGLPALATLIGYIWMAFVSQHRSWSAITATASDDEREEFWLKCVCRAGALVLITTFFLDGGFFKLALAVPFWILLELGCAPSGKPSVKELVEDDPAPQIVRDANIESVPNAKPPSGFRWFLTPAFRIGRWVLWAFLIISVIQVAALSFVNPTTTGPIIVRWTSGLVSGEPTPPARYEWVSMENVPAWFLRAVWVTEDPRFFRHHGFDWEQVQNAIEEARRTGRPSRGASTISMQCARSTFLWQGRSWIRKGLEAYYTKLMELMWSKGRILEVYANVIEFGDGIYGIEAAAQYHFGIRARDLSPEQAAALVAILPNPRNWNPKKPNERVVRRIRMILQRSADVRLPIEAN